LKVIFLPLVRAIIDPADGAEIGHIYVGACASFFLPLCVLFLTFWMVKNIDSMGLFGIVKPL